MFAKDLPLTTVTKILGDHTSKWIDLSFGKCHYKISGQGEPLVLLHNAGMWQGVWDEWVKVLEQDFLVIRPDLPGFGMSEAQKNGDNTFDFYQSILLEFVDALQLSNFRLAGISLGGQVAWRFSLDHSDRVSQLCLINPTGFPGKSVPFVFKLGRSFLGKLLLYLGSYNLIEKNISKLFVDPSKMPADFIKKCQTSQLRAGNRKAFLNFLRSPERYRHEEFKNLSMPVQLIWSTALGKEPFSKALKNINLQLLDNVGNLPIVEQPKQSVALALDFFKP